MEFSTSLGFKGFRVYGLGCGVDIVVALGVVDDDDDDDDVVTFNAQGSCALQDESHDHGHVRFVPQTSTNTVFVYLRRRRGRRRGQAEGFARKTTTQKNGDDSGKVYGIVFFTRAHWAPSSFRAQLKKECPKLCWARTVEKIVLNKKRS